MSCRKRAIEPFHFPPATPHRKAKLLKQLRYHVVDPVSGVVLGQCSDETGARRLQRVVGGEIVKIEAPHG